MVVDDPEPGPVGVLVVRVWFERLDGPCLRVRLTSRLDVTSEEEQSFLVGSTSEAIELADRWLAQFERRFG